MTIQVPKDLLLEKLTNASRFVSNKLSSATALQGILVKIVDGKMHFYSTNLSTYFHTTLTLEEKGTHEFIIEPRKIIEFIQFLSSGLISIDIKENQIAISQGKTKGNFPLIQAQDFPIPPQFKQEQMKLEGSFFQKNLPLVLFSASHDEIRPALTGVNFVSSDEELLMVSTDGFRLSLIKEKNKHAVPSMIVPAEFLSEVSRLAKDAKEVGFIFSSEEKMVFFSVGEDEFYSRIIEGDFPPFERVIPSEVKTTIKMEKDEFLRNIRLISIFARDFSNVVVCEFKKEGLYMRPKKDSNEENTTFQDIEFEGEDQRVAFNYKFVQDLLNHIDSKTIIVEILRSDAPIVFKEENNKSFLHIIMPVRIQE
ncbi:DNA polymerase III subunit beta [Candidatus Roizmanbacteria bacterium]|nr:DNA polymerase III subunit beta [Candidatus Roizmanbacteria bacterium]